MKKLLVLITVLIVTFTFDVFALEYKIVNVTTTFSEEVEFSDVEKVKLIFFGEGIDYVDDASSITSIVELTKENNYSQTINNIKIVDQSNLFAVVDKDNYGSYDCNISLDTSVMDTANINIHISKNNLSKNESSTMPPDILKKIIGNNVVNKKEENKNNNNNENNNNENDENNNDIDSNIVNTTETTTKKVTTIYKEELEKRKEQEKEEKIKKKNNIVSIVFFVILGIILLIVLIFVMYKFAIANK